MSGSQKNSNWNELNEVLGAGAKHNIGRRRDESIGEIVNYMQEQ